MDVTFEVSEEEAALVEGDICARPLAGRLPAEVAVEPPPPRGPAARALVEEGNTLRSAEEAPPAARWAELATRAEALAAAGDVDQLRLQVLAAESRELAGDEEGARRLWGAVMRLAPTSEVASAAALHLGVVEFDAIGCARPSDPVARTHAEDAERLLTRALASSNPQTRLVASEYRGALLYWEGRALEAAVLLEQAATEGAVAGGSGPDEDLRLQLVAAWVGAGVVEDAGARAARIAQAWGRPALAAELLHGLGDAYTGAVPRPGAAADASFERTHRLTGEVRSVAVEELYASVRTDSPYLSLAARKSLDSVAPAPLVYELAARTVLDQALLAAHEGPLAIRIRLARVRLDLVAANVDEPRLAAEIAEVEMRCPVDDPVTRTKLGAQLAALVGDTVESAEEGGFRGGNLGDLTPVALRQGVRLAATWDLCVGTGPEGAAVHFEAARARLSLGDTRPALAEADRAWTEAPGGSPLRREAARLAATAAGHVLGLDPAAPWEPQPPTPERTAFVERALRFGRGTPEDAQAPAALLAAAHQQVRNGEVEAALGTLAEVTERWADRPAAPNEDGDTPAVATGPRPPAAGGDPVTVAAEKLLDLVDRSGRWQAGVEPLRRASTALAASAPVLSAELDRARLGAELRAGVEARLAGPAEARAEWVSGFVLANPAVPDRDLALEQAATDFESAGRWDRAAQVRGVLAAPPDAAPERVERWARGATTAGDLATAAAAWERLGAAGWAAAARVHLALGDEARAEALFGRACEEDPDAGRATWACVELARLPGADASAALDTALARAPVGEAAEAAALWARAARGDRDAEALGSEALAALPESAEALVVREDAAAVMRATLRTEVEGLAQACPALAGMPADEAFLALDREAAGVRARLQAAYSDPALGPSRLALAALAPELLDRVARAFEGLGGCVELDEGQAAWLAEQVAGIDAEVQAARVRVRAEALALPVEGRPYLPELFPLDGAPPLEAPTLVRAAQLPDEALTRLAAQPGDPVRRADAVRAALAAGRLPLAELLLGSSPGEEKDPTALALEGVTAWGRGREGLALRFWRAALTADPAQPDARRALGLVALRAGDGEVARHLLHGLPTAGDPSLSAALTALDAEASEDPPSPVPPPESP